MGKVTSIQFDGPVPQNLLQSGVWLSQAAETFGPPEKVETFRRHADEFRSHHHGGTAESFTLLSDLDGSEPDHLLHKRLEDEAIGPWRMWIAFRSILRNDLEAKLAFGHLLAFGEQRPGAGFEFIHPRAWQYLDVASWSSNKVQGEAGTYYFVRVLDPLPPKQSARPPSEKAFRQWFRDRVATWPDDKRAPSEEADFQAARDAFEKPPSRDGLFRMVRRRETPLEWHQPQGNRMLWGKVKAAGLTYSAEK